MGGYAPFEGRKRLDTSGNGRMEEDNAPLDTLWAQTVINNTLHLADQAGQVRAAWSGLSASVKTSNVGAELSWANRVTGVYEPVGVLGPFPVRLDADGTPYALRARLKGRIVNSGDTVTFRLVVAPFGTSLGEMGDAGDNVLTATTTSTTAAWIGSETLLNLTAEQAAAARKPVSTIDGVGGDPVSTNWSLMGAYIWGTCDVVRQAGAGTVSAVYLAEYLEP